MQFLVLKNFLKTDYRGIAELLGDTPSLAAVLELKKIPHFTTVQKASKRLLTQGRVRQLLDAPVKRRLGRRKRVARAAIDSTGLECCREPRCPSRRAL